MIGTRVTLMALAAAVAAAVGLRSAHAAPVVTILNDSGDRVTTTSTQTSDNQIVPLYGSASMTITPLTTGNGFELTFVPNSGFYASANNLSGSMSQTLSGELTFNVTFDSKVNLTTNIYEDGIWGTSGDGVVSATSATASGIVVTELDDGSKVKSSNSFATNATTSFDASTGSWSLFDQAKGFASNYQTYKVVVDNDLFASTAANPAVGYASIAKKDFSIIFTFDGSNGGGSPPTPEPASLGVLALGSLALLARRRK